MEIVKPQGKPVIKVTHTTCDHHKLRPQDHSYPGCTCSGSYSLHYEKEKECQ